MIGLCVVAVLTALGGLGAVGLALGGVGLTGAAVLAAPAFGVASLATGLSAAVLAMRRAG